MEILVSGVGWGVVMGGMVVVTTLLLKEKVEVGFEDLPISAAGTLMMIFVLRLVGEQYLLAVDLGNINEIAAFLVVTAVFYWLTKAVIVARLLPPKGE